MGFGRTGLFLHHLHLQPLSQIQILRDSAYAPYPSPFVNRSFFCQVILAFLLSAYVTWTVVAIGYGCGYVDESLLGNLDRRLIRVKPRQSDRWGPLLVKVVLVLR